MRHPMLPMARRLTTLLLLAAACPALAGPTPDDKDMQAQRRPKTFITVFNNGYSGDPMPTDPAKFDQLLKVITTEGHFNAVLCKYSPEREALCKKYKVGMMVDLLAAGTHVFQNPKEAEALCRKLRGNPTIVAYHLWSDRFGNTGAGRVRDIDNVHAWDPTHATYIGTYRSGGINYFAKSDFISYYDFSWKRGPGSNFSHLLAAYNTAKLHDNRVGRYVETDAGLAGKGNVNRMLYIQNTSIALGMRGTLWFIGSRIMNMGAIQFNQLGKDVGAVNAWIQPMWTEIPKLGLPYAIYSTPWTKDYNDKPATGMPSGLADKAFPADFWIQPTAGEFVMGLSKYNSTDTDVAYIANHNAYAPQDVKLKFTKTVKPSLFDRATGQWKPLTLTDGVASFILDAAGGAILRFDN